MTQPSSVQCFLDNAGWGKASRSKMAGDASTRRYERIAHGVHTAVLMIAPPETAPEVEQFINIARYLDDIGLSAPFVLASDPPSGLVLLEDLGDDLFAKIVPGDIALESETYSAAMDVLAHIHQSAIPSGVPTYDIPLMLERVRLAAGWYRQVDSATARFPALLQPHLERIMASSLVVTLRDYHAENLIWLPARDGRGRVGLLDFQDAMLAPAAYDVCSLLYDARRDVSPDVQAGAIQHYIDASGRDPGDFAYEMAVCTAQRNLRILGVFARLALTVGKTSYLEFVPRVWDHLITALDHPELAGLRATVLEELPVPDENHVNSIKAKCQ